MNCDGVRKLTESVLRSVALPLKGINVLVAFRLDVDPSETLDAVQVALTELVDVGKAEQVEYKDDWYRSTVADATFEKMNQESDIRTWIALTESFLSSTKESLDLINWRVATLLDINPEKTHNMVSFALTELVNVGKAECIYGKVKTVRRYKSSVSYRAIEADVNDDENARE